MSRDENVYPDPTRFDPTRFLGNNQQMDPNKFVFGFGRRVCPGRNRSSEPFQDTPHEELMLRPLGIHLAESSVFLNITNILANFTISKKVGEDGQMIEPEIQWSTGTIM